MTRPILAAAMAVVLLGACSEHRPQLPANVRAMCSLAELPHATTQEESALRHEAKVKLSNVTVFGNTVHNKAVVKAVLEITQSGTTLPTSLPSPLASALAPSGDPFGLPSLDDALAHLRTACG